MFERIKDAVMPHLFDGVRLALLAGLLPASIGGAFASCNPFCPVSEWPQERFSAEGTNFNSNENALRWNTFPAAIQKWSVPLAHPYTASGLAVANNTVYVNDGGKLMAIDLQSGSIKWSLLGFTTAPSLDGGHLYGGISAYGPSVLYAFDAATGAGIGIIDSVSVQYAPVVAGGVVYGVTTDGHLVADYPSGGRLWSTSAVDPYPTTSRKIAVGSGKIFRVYRSSGTRWMAEARDMTTGELAWSTVIAPDIGPRLASSPTYVGDAHGGSVYVVMDYPVGGRLIRLRAVDGSVSSLIEGVTGDAAFGIANGVIVANMETAVVSQFVEAIDINSGHVLWSQPLGFQTWGQEITLAGDAVIVCDQPNVNLPGNLRVWSIATGAPPPASLSQWPDQKCRHKPVVAGGKVIFVDPLSSQLRAWGP